MLGRLRAVSRPKPLAMSRGAVNGYGSAADFYDTFGVNIHAIYPAPYANHANMMTDLAALGMRHVRDGSFGSWYDFRFQFARPMWVLMKNRNAALPAPSSTDGGQPIFLTTFTSGWGPGRMASPAQFGIGAGFNLDEWFQQMDGGHGHYNGDTGPSATIPGVGSPVPNGTTVNPNNAIPNPWNHADAELHWSIVGAVGGPNEPLGTTHWNELGPWIAGVFSRTRRRIKPVLGSLPHVTVNGLVTTPALARQLPVVGIVVMDNGLISTHGWDWEKGTNTCDVGDKHPYHVGHEPSDEYVDRFAVNEPSPYGSGATKLPWFVTEFGHISRAVDSATGARNANAHAGYWPAPDDVIAELMIRTFVIFYLRGIRRTFVYEFYDGTNDAAAAEANFGLLKYDRTKKDQFYSLRNLLSLVGFSEAARVDQEKLAITVTGYVGGANNHIAMYDGQGDAGFVTTGNVYHSNTNKLYQLQIQKSATEWLQILSPGAIIWDREPGNWAGGIPTSLGDVTAGRKTAPTQSLTVQLPAGVTEVRECTPTAGGIATPENGRTWSAPLTINGSNQVSVSIAGKTKILKIVKP